MKPATAVVKASSKSAARQTSGESNNVIRSNRRLEKNASQSFNDGGSSQLGSHLSSVPRPPKFIAKRGAPVSQQPNLVVEPESGRNSRSLGQDVKLNRDVELLKRQVTVVSQKAP